MEWYTKDSYYWQGQLQVCSKGSLKTSASESRLRSARNTLVWEEGHAKSTLSCGCYQLVSLRSDAPCLGPASHWAWNGSSASVNGLPAGTCSVSSPSLRYRAEACQRAIISRIGTSCTWKGPRFGLSLLLPGFPWPRIPTNARHLQFSQNNWHESVMITKFLFMESMHWK